MQVKNFLLEQKLKKERIEILTAFIHRNPDARELKRAIAVKMAIEGEAYGNITDYIIVGGLLFNDANLSQKWNQFGYSMLLNSPMLTHVKQYKGVL